MHENKMKSSSIASLLAARQVSGESLPPAKP
jgi:hypothetical protein